MRLIWLFSCAGLIFAAASTGEPATGQAKTKRRPAIGRFLLPLATGEFAAVEVEPRGVDIAVELLDPGGSSVGALDRLPCDEGIERVYVHAPQAGVYQIRVTDANSETPTARFIVKPVERRPALPGDITRAAAWVRRGAADRKGRSDASPAELTQAKTLRLETLGLWRSIGDEIEVAYALRDLGQLHFRPMASRDLPEARRYLDEALRLFERLGDLHGRALTIADIGWVHESAGERRQAVERYEEALALWNSQERHMPWAMVLNRLGLAYVSLGKGEKALVNYRAVLELVERWGNRLAVASLNESIGLVYAGWGDDETARTYLERSLKLAPKDSDGRTHYHLANVYQRMGKLERARREAREALRISRKTNDRSFESGALAELAEIDGLAGDSRKAMAAYQEALTINEQMGNRLQAVRSRLSIGGFLEKLGDIQASLRTYEEALAGCRALDGCGEEAGALVSIARCQYQLGRLNEAKANAERALMLMEARRKNVAERRLRIAMLSRIYRHYEFYVRLLMRLHVLEPTAGYDIEALEISERRRGRGLLETLARANATAPDAPALSLKEIQTQVLDPETVLLEYALGEDASYLWVVGADSFTATALPPRAEIEKAARRFYTALTARNVRPKGETPVARHQRLTRADLDLREAGQLLSQMLLSPAGELSSVKRLLVVSEGALQYIPFGALPDPEQKAAPADKPALLVERFEIVTAPSASTIAVLRASQSQSPAAGKTVAVIADPVYSTSDERVRLTPTRGESGGTRSAEEEAQDIFLQSASRMYGNSSMLTEDVFPRLPFARVEAEAIARVVSAEFRTDALGFGANRAMALEAETAEHRILHFATHAVLNTRQPELSGVVLSLVDERGRAQDGLLRLREVSDLKLHSDLVVLSACQTALGQNVRGEGLVGLTWAFLNAGARRVLASLWRVDDRATAELMARVYGHMLGEPSQDAAAALNAAQRELLRDETLSHPYYWAPFVLQGPWNRP